MALVHLIQLKNLKIMYKKNYHYDLVGNGVVHPVEEHNFQLQVASKQKSTFT